MSTKLTKPALANLQALTRFTNPATETAATTKFELRYIKEIAKLEELLNKQAKMLDTATELAFSVSQVKGKEIASVRDRVLYSCPAGTFNSVVKGLTKDLKTKFLAAGDHTVEATCSVAKDVTFTLSITDMAKDTRVKDGDDVRIAAFDFKYKNVKI